MCNLAHTNGPTDYPADGGDDDDLSGDDADNKEEEEASKEDKEEHLAPVDSTNVSPVVDLVPSAEETEPFETDESAATPAPPPTYHTITTTHTSPTYAKAPLGYKAAGIQLRVVSPLPSPTSPPTHHPLPLPEPSISHKANILEVDIPPRKSTLDAKLRRDRVREIGYGITDVWEDPAEATEEVPPTTVAELSRRVMDLVTTVRQDIDGIYVWFEDAQYDRALLRGQVNMLHKDRQYHLHTSMLVKSEARVAREAWEQSMGCSRAIHDEL
ncbi:hypothetical protein Tco_0058375 [Tanacetum coccineum]